MRKSIISMSFMLFLGQALATSPVPTELRVECDKSGDQTIKVELPYWRYLVVEVYDNPSTGYHWKTSDKELEPVFHSFCKDQKNPAPGCGGVTEYEIYRSKIEDDQGLLGTTTYKFSQYKPGGKKTRTCKVKIKLVD
jgi:predicted secreted protein